MYMEWDDIDTLDQDKSQGASSGWNIKNLLGKDKVLITAHNH